MIGSFLSDLLDSCISALSTLVDHFLILWNVNPVIHSLVMDGIFNGVGSVLSFLPIIVYTVLLPVFAGRQRDIWQE